MKQLHALALFVQSLLVPAVGLSQPYELHTLPRASARSVIGTWRVVEPDIPCTRSIEHTGQGYFMVARCKDGSGANGSKGLRLERLGENTYRGQFGATYSVHPNGWLLMSGEGQVSMRARPQKQLWPE